MELRAVAQSTHEKEGPRVVVHGDDFLPGGTRHQLDWMQGIMNEHFESKHILMAASSESGKSLVMWNRKIVPLDEY